MANSTSKTLKIYSSGIKRPRYFDRQQLRAGDLALEQEYLSARGRQLTRHLHGWGVVCGAYLLAGESGIGLSEGFAITPLGDALHIPAVDDVDMTALVENSCCGKPGSDCEDVRPAGEREENLPPTRTVYLVARPAVLPSDPRTGVPEDCGHPGNRLEYSRECDAVSLGIVCELVPPHEAQELQCERWRELFCPESRRSDYGQLLEELLSCPPEVSEEANYVVLATLDLVFSRLEAEPVEVEVIRYADRRLLLPTRLLQDYLSCLCSAPSPTPSPTPTPTPTATPTLTATRTLVPTMTMTVTRTMRPTRTIEPPFTLVPTIFTREPNTRFPGPVMPDLDVLVYDPLRGRELPVDTLVDARRRDSLHSMGINSVADLYAADTSLVAERLQISEVQVAELKDNAREKMKRADPIALDESSFDIDRGITMKPEEVHNIGAARASTLRDNGYSSVADVANATPDKLAGVLSVSESQARGIIRDAQLRITR